MTVEQLMNDFTFTEITPEVLAECEHFSCGVGEVTLTNISKKKNGFTYLFPSEEEESKSTRKDKAVVPQATRLMYFDLMDLQPRKISV